MKLVFGPHGYLAQCPDLDATCPSCGQFRSLQAAVVHLEKTVEELTHRVSNGRWRSGVLPLRVYLLLVVFVCGRAGEGEGKTRGS